MSVEETKLEINVQAAELVQADQLVQQEPQIDVVTLLATEGIAEGGGSFFPSIVL